MYIFICHSCSPQHPRKANFYAGRGFTVTGPGENYQKPPEFLPGTFGPCVGPGRRPLLRHEQKNRQPSGWTVEMGWLVTALCHCMAQKSGEAVEIGKPFWKCLENSGCDVHFHQLETPKTSNPVTLKNGTQCFPGNVILAISTGGISEPSTIWNLKMIVSWHGNPGG